MVRNLLKLLKIWLIFQTVLQLNFYPKKWEKLKSINLDILNQAMNIPRLSLGHMVNKM